MWPLESAKIDSDWPRRSRSSPVSRNFQGSHVNRSSSITSFRQQVGEVFDHHVRAVSVQSLGLAGAVDPDHSPESARAAGLDSRERVLVDGGLFRLCVQNVRRFQVGVGGGLALQMLTLRVVAVDLGVEEALELCRVQHLGGVLARGDDRDLLTGGACCVDVSDCAFVGLYAVLVDQVEEQVVLAFGDGLDLVVRELDVSRGEEVVDAGVAGLAIYVGVVVLNLVEWFLPSGL